MFKKFTKVLVVDDNEIDRIISQEIIKSMGITNEVIDFEKGKEALEYINKNCKSGNMEKQNLIFLDINMPGMNGFQFLQKFNQMAKHEGFMIVMLSSSIDSNDKLNSYNLNASHYIEKPLTKEKISSIFNIYFNSLDILPK
ncbi:response regulator [soil metagenome]